VATRHLTILCISSQFEADLAPDARAPLLCLYPCGTPGWPNLIMWVLCSLKLISHLTAIHASDKTGEADGPNLPPVPQDIRSRAMRLNAYEVGG
jgi:hypothetical protein